jgi:hypothetical protein
VSEGESARTHTRACVRACVRVREKEYVCRPLTLLRERDASSFVDCVFRQVQSECQRTPWAEPPEDLAPSDVAARRCIVFVAVVCFYFLHVHYVWCSCIVYTRVRACVRAQTLTAGDGKYVCCVCGGAFCVFTLSTLQEQST